MKDLDKYLDIIAANLPDRIKENLDRGIYEFDIILDSMSNYESIPENEVKRFIDKIYAEYEDIIQSIEVNTSGYFGLTDVRQITIGCATVLKIVIKRQNKFITLDNIAQQIPDMNALAYKLHIKEDVRDLPIRIIFDKGDNTYNYLDTDTLQSISLIEIDGKYCIALSTLENIREIAKKDKNVKVLGTFNPSVDLFNLIYGDKE